MPAPEYTGRRTGERSRLALTPICPAQPASPPFFPAKENPFVKDNSSRDSLALSRRRFLAGSGLGAAVVLMNGLPGVTSSLPVDVLARPPLDDENPVASPVHVSLDGRWKLFCFPQGTYKVTEPRQLLSTGLSAIDATVPGEGPLELSRIGKLPADLYYGENIRTLIPYELYEWWYQREFPTPKDTAGRRAELCFHGVDCLATYWLNGAKIGDSENALIEHRFDVTDALRPAGPNLLTIRLRSARI